MMPGNCAHPEAECLTKMPAAVGKPRLSLQRSAHLCFPEQKSEEIMFAIRLVAETGLATAQYFVDVVPLSLKSISKLSHIVQSKPKTDPCSYIFARNLSTQCLTEEIAQRGGRLQVLHANCSNIQAVVAQQVIANTLGIVCWLRFAPITTVIWTFFHSTPCVSPFMATKIDRPYPAHVTQQRPSYWNLTTQDWY